MVLPLICVFIFPAALISIIRALYFVVLKNGKRPKKYTRTEPVKTLIVLGSGGHTTEILRVVQQLDQEKYCPRIYVQAQTDEISSKKVKQIETNTKYFRILEIPRSREVRQSYSTSALTTVYAIFQSFPIIWREKPDLLLCNGPGTCIPLCLVAFFFNTLFLSNIKIVFVESFCRVKNYSLSGKILYYLANNTIVQWPYLNGATYPRSTCTIPTEVVAESLQWQNLQEDLEEHSPTELKYYLQQIFSRLKNFTVMETSDAKKPKICFKWVERDLLTIEACLDRTWEMLNSGYWKDVPIYYRHCYSLCSILKAMLLEISIHMENDQNKSINRFKEIIQQIDKGILLGVPLPRNLNLLTDIASNLNQHFSKFTDLDKHHDNIIKVDKISLCTTLFSGFSSITQFAKPSMETFYCDIFRPKIPALLEGCIEHWRALHLWQDIEYLQKVAGNRIVPIEIGSRYTEDDWTQNLVSFSDFLNTHISNKNDRVGYLAQHQLFDQIPELKKDFSIPDYCSFSDKDDNEELPDINAWFGPSGTVSPLHYDPKNNLLCQVFGYKRIVLYSPEDDSNLYPYETRLLCNTARVDPYNPDLKNYPNFEKAKGFMCYLKPGDMLFIPPKWWHHVVGLTPSFSISFWWE